MPDLDVLLFFDGRMASLPLYEQLEALLFREFPAAHRRVQKTQITFTGRRVFACVSFARVRRKAELPAHFLVLTFGLPAPLASPRVIPVAVRPDRWTHHVVLSAPEELDGELLAWLRASYAFSERKR